MKPKTVLLVVLLALIAASYTSAISGPYTDRFLEQWNKIHNSANGYFSPEGAPYHSIETVICEAPDQGHESTSEAYSYYAWLEAMYGTVTGNWSSFDTAWSKLETHLIPPSQYNSLAGYNASSPATYAAEWDLPDNYPSELMFGTPVGRDPVGPTLISTYGQPVYGMHWIVDCDDFYGFYPSANIKPVFINTFQRGPQESTWETIPQPSIEKFQWGKSGQGFLSLFTIDTSYSQQWRFTDAPDADSRAIQAAYWASRGGYTGSAIGKAAKMGDYLRLSFFDKYFRTIGCQSPTAGGNGYDSCHYLLSWYYAWGGGIGSGWSWIIGCSHVHMGYQNPLAAWVLSTQSPFRPQASGAQADWAASLTRQIDFYQWLQSARGPFAGGATNSWKGRYLAYPSGVGKFNNMAYEANPVYLDPGSNTWPGFQAWSIERLAEYYYVTGDAEAKAMLDKWAAWLIDDINLIGDADFEIPGQFSWSGDPGNWSGAPQANSLSVTTTAHGKDLGVAAGLVKTLIFYAAKSGNTEAGNLAKEVLDRMYTTYRDSKGYACPETRGDYNRFFDQTVYVPAGWSGTMPNGDQIVSGIKFIDIRTKYLSDPGFATVQNAYNQGQSPAMTYHRFWAQADIALANLAYGMLLGGEDGGATTAPTAVPTTGPTANPTTGPTPVTGLKGDVNSSGAVDIVDALLVAQYYVGLDPANFNTAVADVNCSGGIDIVDALMIAQKYVGLITDFPC